MNSGVSKLEQKIKTDLIKLEELLKELPEDNKDSLKQTLSLPSPKSVLDFDQKNLVIQKNLQELQDLQKKQQDLQKKQDKIAQTPKRQKLEETQTQIEETQTQIEETQTQITEQKKTLIQNIYKYLIDLSNKEWPYKVYGIYSFIHTLITQTPKLFALVSSLNAFTEFLDLSLSLYKVVTTSLTAVPILNSYLQPSMGKYLVIPSMSGWTKQKRFTYLFDNNVFKTLTKVGEYFIIVSHIAVVPATPLTRFLTATNLPFLYDELPTAINSVVEQFKDVFDLITMSFNMGGGLLRRKKTRYYKRKSTRHKRRVTRKINNGPFIQTKEMMLSSYLINNSKPIIRGYSIQKKIIPNKKLISIHTNIISNQKVRKNKKKTIKKLKK